MKTQVPRRNNRHERRRDFTKSDGLVQWLFGGLAPDRVSSRLMTRPSDPAQRRKREDRDQDPAHDIHHRLKTGLHALTIVRLNEYPDERILAKFYAFHNPATSTRGGPGILP